jgi:hypothetical protein
MSANQAPRESPTRGIASMRASMLRAETRGVVRVLLGVLPGVAVGVPVGARSWSGEGDWVEVADMCVHPSRRPAAWRSGRGR